MTFVYICDACRRHDHFDCEKATGLPLPKGYAGGGICICSHSLNRSKFEKSVWDSDGEGGWDETD